MIEDLEKNSNKSLGENGDVKVYEKRNKGEYIKLLTRYIKKFVEHKTREYDN